MTEQTPDQIYAELLDLEEDPEAEPISQYEYTDMQDELVPGIDYPTDQPEAEGVETPPESAPLDSSVDQQSEATIAQQ